MRWMRERSAVAAVLGFVLALPLVLLRLLRLPSSVRLDVGPGDGGYVQGLDERWRYDGEATFRVMTRRSRLRLPLTVEGPATLTLRVAPLVPIVLRIAFDDGTVREVSVPASAEFSPEDRSSGNLPRARSSSSASTGVYQIRSPTLLQRRGFSFRGHRLSAIDGTCTLGQLLGCTSAPDPSPRVDRGAGPPEARATRPC